MSTLFGFLFWVVVAIGLWGSCNKASEAQDRGFKIIRVPDKDIARVEVPVTPSDSLLGAGILTYTRWIDCSLAPGICVACYMDVASGAISCVRY